MTGERTTGESTARGDMPSEIELLLPWYAAGTLDVAEARQVEAALAADPELAARYEWVRAEFAQETAIGDAAGDPGAEIERCRRPARRLGVDLGEQRLHRARRRRAQGLVEMDGLAELLAHQFVAAGKLGIIGERRLHALRIATAERSRRVPRQQQLDIARFAFVRRIHGQPRSIPCSLSSSDNFLRA